MKDTICVAALASALVTPCTSFAQSAGDWVAGVGVSYLVEGTGDTTFRNVTLKTEAEDGLAFNVEYFITEKLGVEFFLSADDFLSSDPNWAPPVLGLNYHFTQFEQVTPFVGAGINYGEYSLPVAPIGIVTINDSWGPALHAGVDFKLNDRDQVRLSARYMELDFKVDLGSTGIGNATLEPVILGVYYMRRF